MKWISQVYLGLLLMSVLTVSGLRFYDATKPSEVNNAADITLPALNLYMEYEHNAVLANQFYRDKTLKISGKIYDIIHLPDYQTMLVFQNASQLSGVIGIFEQSSLPVKINDQVTLRGRCEGKVVDVMLVDCELIGVNEAYP